MCWVSVYDLLCVYITKNLSLYVKIIIYVCALRILKLMNGDAWCILNAISFFETVFV